VLGATTADDTPRVCFTTSRASGGVPICPTPASPHLVLFCGKGFNVDLENVREGHHDITLARVTVDKSSCFNPKVKIDFSCIFKVEDDDCVKIAIALIRDCDGDCDGHHHGHHHDHGTILQTWELRFDDVEELPFSFTFCDEDFPFGSGFCEYTVEIIDIDVRGGERVDELRVKNAAINAIVQR